MITITRIQNFIAGRFSISHANLLCHRRVAVYARPRMIAMALCRRMLQCPFSEIAQAFDRDHSTVINAVDKMEEKEKAVLDRLEADLRKLTD